MIEKDDPTTQRHKFGRDGRVISDEYVRSIQKLRRLVNEFDALTEPEVSDSGGSGVGATDDVPSASTPPVDSFRQYRPVGFERRPKFGYSGPHGCRWFPMERDGHRSWTVLIPQADVPRVQLWTTDSDGRPVVTPGPSGRYFIVGTYEGDDISVLFRGGEWTIERGDFWWESDVGLTGTVLNVNHWTSWVTNDIAVAADEERPAKPLPCYFPGSPIDPSNPVRKSVPDGEDVLVVVRMFSDEID